MTERSSDATLVLVRHGETEWNVAGRIQGYLDSALTTLGGEQGRRVAERLACEKIAAVYASPAARARDTGELIAAPHGLTIKLVDDLRERCYGCFEGLTAAEIESQNDPALARWLQHPEREELAPTGGETQPEMSQRAMASLREIAARHPGETVVIATHGGPIKSALFAILNIPITSWQRAWVSNGSLTTLRGTPDELRVACFNDTCHLDSTYARPRSIEG